MQRKDFPSIDFGWASAQAEATNSPSLLLNGFVDPWNVSTKLLNGSQWLVLGYKGSGKSAIAERLRLLHMRQQSAFVRLLSLENFEWQRFSTLLNDTEAPETILPTAWSWLLYVKIFASMMEDASLRLGNEVNHQQLCEAFVAMGMNRTLDLNDVLRIFADPTFDLIVPEFARSTANPSLLGSSRDFKQYLAIVQHHVSCLKSSKRHIIVIDGLDDVLTVGHLQYSATSGLIYEVGRINQFLASWQVPAKVVVLCRTDIYETLGSANKNKLRQDYSVNLDWNSNPKLPERSMLVKIANLRGAIALGQPVSTFDVLSTFLPSRIYKRGTSTPKYLLDMTRHTPRDFLQLLRFIQESSTGPKTTNDDIRNGLREYSTKYFLPEIYDELHGYADAEEIKHTFAAIGRLGRRDFAFVDLEESARSGDMRNATEVLKKVLYCLYECSAVGNIRPARASRRPGLHFLSYKYRNRHSSVNYSERLILHRGLWRAMNLELQDFSPDIDPDSQEGEDST